MVPEMYQSRNGKTIGREICSKFNYWPVGALSPSLVMRARDHGPILAWRSGSVPIFIVKPLSDTGVFVPRNTESWERKRC